MKAREFVKEVFKNIEDRLRLMEARDAVAPPATPIVNDTYTGEGVDYKSPRVPGPGIPMLMGNNDTDLNARLWDYNFMSNLNIVPRAEIPYIPSFAQLTFAFNNCDDIRVAHEWRTDQLLGVDKEVAFRKGTKNKNTKRLEQAQRLVEWPDPLRNWNYEQWTRVALKQETVTDALTVYPLKTFGGDTVAFMQVDGRTIKPIIDYMGAQPQSPEPAYEQFIKGYPYRAFSMDDMLYVPSRPNYDRPYGESRVEELMNVARISADNMRFEGEFYSEGNIPEAVLMMPISFFQGEGPSVSKKIMQYQTLLDELAGRNASRRRLHLAPIPVEKMQEIKAREFKPELPEWLVRRICVRFGCPSHLFVSDTNRATAEQVSKDIHDGNFNASLKWLKATWDRMLAMAGFPECELNYKPTKNFAMVTVQGIALMNQSIDPQTGLPLITREEARSHLGYDSGELTDDEPQAQQPTTPSAPIAEGQQQAQPMQTKTAPPSLRPVIHRKSQLQFNTDRQRHTMAMLGAVKPMLNEQERKAIEQAKRAAAQRGKKVV